MPVDRNKTPADSYANVKVAHPFCNLSKGARRSG